MQNDRQQYALTSSLIRGEVNTPEVTAGRTLAHLVVPDEWATILTVPERKTQVVTNFWLRSAHSSAVTVRFRHSVAGGSPVEFFAVYLDPSDNPANAYHHWGAKVLEAGSTLEVIASVVGVVGLTLDGGEAQQT